MGFRDLKASRDQPSSKAAAKVKMKCILVFALLFVSVYTAPINDEVDLLTVEFDPEDDCVAVLGKAHCDFLESDGGDHAYGLLEDLIEQKLKIFDWLIGKVPIPALQDIIRDFVANNREGIKDALKRGGLAVLGILRDIVFGKILPMLPSLLGR